MILFIDDQALLTKTLREYLTDVGEYEVIHAMDWEEAIHYANQFKDKIGIVLLDIMLPSELGGSIKDRFGVSTGLRLSLRIKEILPKVPIISITVRDDIADKDREEAKIHEIFIKPINPDKLLKTIRKLYIH